MDVLIDTLVLKTGQPITVAKGYNPEVDGEHLQQALAKVVLPTDDRKFLERTIDFGFVVGEDNCVLCRAKDRIGYMEKIGTGRSILYIFDRMPEKTSKVSVVLSRIDGDRYELVCARYGDKRPLPIWDNSQPSSSSDSYRDRFWKEHGLVGECAGYVVPVLLPNIYIKQEL